MLPGQISIRAPTRGATGTQWKSTAITTDFNPRSHEGSDLVKSVCVAGMNYFNPRSHEGSDRCCGGKCIRLIISIRAPTRGATIRKMLQSTQRRYFNPRSHEGSDVGYAPLILYLT